MITHTLIEKRLPVARWEIVEVTFETAHVDKVISHTLRPNKPHFVKWEIIDANAPGVLYRGEKASTDKYVVLRCSEIGTYEIRLYIPARYETDTTLPQTTFTP